MNLSWPPSILLIALISACRTDCVIICACDQGLPSAPWISLFTLLTTWFVRFGSPSVVLSFVATCPSYGSPLASPIGFIFCWWAWRVSLGSHPHAVSANPFSLVRVLQSSHGSFGWGRKLVHCLISYSLYSFFLGTSPAIQYSYQLQESPVAPVLLSLSRPSLLLGWLHRHVLRPTSLLLPLPQLPPSYQTLHHLSFQIACESPL